MRAITFQNKQQQQIKYKSYIILSGKFVSIAELRLNKLALERLPSLTKFRFKYLFHKKLVGV